MSKPFKEEHPLGELIDVLMKGKVAIGVRQ